MSSVLRSFIKSVQALAASSESQIAHLQRMGLDGNNVDELALEFDDSVKGLPGLVKSGALSADAAECVTLIDRLLAQMSSSGDDCWSAEALREDARWQHVREAASACLTRLEAQASPALSGN